ncbi:MAG: hypothetical protein AB7T22_14590 [Calditrichaceae bacterium]
MLLTIFKRVGQVMMGMAVFIACQQSDLATNANNIHQDSGVLSESATVQSDPAGVLKIGFEHALIVRVDGEDYYFAGAPDGPNGETDIPGHYWKMIGKNKLLGRHFNTGPFGSSKWWSSDAPDGALLYAVNAVIDTWSVHKAKFYARAGFVHYHELVRVSDGALHPTKIVWLQHVALMSFTLDGGPAPALSHVVNPGIDFEFIPNGMTPYGPED